MSRPPDSVTAPPFVRPVSPARTEPLRVLVAAGDAAQASALHRQLTGAGHAVVASAASAAEAVARAAALTPDVVLVDASLPDGLGTVAAAQITAAGPEHWFPAVVLCTGDADTLLDAGAELTGAVAVLPTPAPLAVLDGTVRLAAARAREVAALRAECAEVHRRLEERKLIERAKGILMRRTGSSEQEAYRILQRSSQDRATPMAKLAQAVLDSEPGTHGQARGGAHAERA